MKDRKKKILWVSPYVPYDTVDHGGGKTHNYYIKYFQRSGKYEIVLLSLCMKSEMAKIDLDKYQITYRAAVLDPNPAANTVRRVADRLSYANPWNSYGGISLCGERWQMDRQLKAYIAGGEIPDVVILQWTFSALYAAELRIQFPGSMIIAIEEDVTFLNYQRRADRASGAATRFFWKKRTELGRKAELDALRQADLIVTNNPKDTALLKRQGITERRIFTSAPYFDNYSRIKRKPNGRDILFWGAMSRPENYQSAIWFITRVMPLLEKEDIRFIIAGGQPNPSLLRYESSCVVVTGFIESPEVLFRTCLCLVAPLVGGAGIKIKILEAMSAGIPVLTNEIGIEGIPAQDQKEYFFCEEPEEYVACIKSLLSGRIDQAAVEEKAKAFIQANCDLPRKLDQLMGRVEAGI